MRSRGICLPLSAFLHSARCPLGPPSPLQTASFHLSLWLSTFCRARSPPLLYPLSTDGHPGDPHTLAAITKPAVTVWSHVSLRSSVLSFFGEIPESGIPGPSLSLLTALALKSVLPDGRIAAPASSCPCSGNVFFHLCVRSACVLRSKGSAWKGLVSLSLGRPIFRLDHLICLHLKQLLLDM